MLHGESNRANAMDRRTFARLAGGLAVTLGAGVLLGCGEAGGATAPKDVRAGAKAGDVKTAGQGNSAGKGATSGEQGAVAGGKTQAGAAEYPSVMVTYFSATGHTEAVAQAAAKVLGVEPFAIVPAEPYTADDLDYNDAASRVSTEHTDSARHVELADFECEGFADAFAAAQTVLLGYPIWWGGASWVMDDFVTGNDFTGKGVVPFCTSASSPLGSSADDLAELAGTGDWQEGTRFAIGTDEAAVAQWLADLGIQAD